MTDYEIWKDAQRRAIAAELEAEAAREDYDELLERLLPPPPPPPIITRIVVSDLAPVVGTTVSFSVEVDGGAPPLTYAWDFGDGTTGTGNSTAHEFGAIGSYTVAVTVTDGLSRSATESVEIETITVTAPIPPAPTESPDGTRAGRVVNAAGQVFTLGPSPAPYKLLCDGADTGGKGYEYYYTQHTVYAWAGVTYKWYRWNPVGRNWISCPDPTVPGGPTTPPPTTMPPTPGLPPASPPVTPADIDRMLLPRATLDSIRRRAVANDPQFVAFKREHDSWVNRPLKMSYQASGGHLAAGFSLLYLVYKDDAPALAAVYADKAIAAANTLCRDYMKLDGHTRQWIGRGDGVTRTFAFPHQGVKAPIVFVGTFFEQERTRSADPIDVTEHALVKWIQIASAQGGPPDYIEGVDWQFSPDKSVQAVDWSLPGREPATGEKYWLTISRYYEAPVVSNYVRNGDSITFDVAPRKDQGIYAEYLYGDHYQQSGDGFGGLSSIKTDSTYTSRSLGYVAFAHEWLAGSPAAVPYWYEWRTMLRQWADYVAVSGYKKDSAASNYGIGHYWLRVLDAIVSGNQARIEAVKSWRANVLVPTLTNLQNSLRGGWWAEGWTYGQTAAIKLLQAALVLKSATDTDISAEREWAAEVVTHLCHASPAQGQMYDGGDHAQYPPIPFPGRNMVSTLWHMLDGFSESSKFAAEMLLRMGGASNDWTGQVFHVPADAVPVAWESSEPLEHYAAGTGLVVARDRWAADNIWISFKCGNLLNADHQVYGEGNLEIQRGRDRLLVDANRECRNQWGPPSARFSNNVLVQTWRLLGQGNGTQTVFPLPAAFVSGKFSAWLVDPSQASATQQGASKYVIEGNLIRFLVAPTSSQDVYADFDRSQPYPHYPGIWYGTPGCRITEYNPQLDYVEIACDYRAGYSQQNTPGVVQSVSELTRQVVFLRPNIIVVYDRVTTAKPEYAKILQWHFLPTAEFYESVTANGFVVKVGSSRLVANVFSPSLISLESEIVQNSGQDGLRPIRRVWAQQTSPANEMRFTTVFQALALGAAANMVEHVFDVSTETIQVAGKTVRFNRTGPVACEVTL